MVCDRVSVLTMLALHRDLCSIRRVNTCNLRGTKTFILMSISYLDLLSRVWNEMNTSSQPEIRRVLPPSLIRVKQWKGGIIKDLL